MTKSIRNVCSDQETKTSWFIDDDENHTGSKNVKMTKIKRRLRIKELELKKQKQELLEAQQEAQIEQQKDFMNAV